MARVIVISLVVIILNCMVGCRPADSGRSQLLGSEISASAAVSPATGSETDLVEQMTNHRQAYYNALKSLIAYYDQKGNNMKLRWASEELSKLESLPHYNYIIEAAMAPENLRPTDSISEADLLFKEAYRVERDAGLLPVFRNASKLREALGLYNQLIKKFPKSDKIDDAAYRAAGIYEHFKDYSIAVPYYKRVFQWNPKTEYPARYRAGQILDRYLERKDEALELYRQSLESETLNPEQKQYVELRIKEITKGQ